MDYLDSENKDLAEKNFETTPELDISEEREPIYVTKTYLPDIDKYKAYIDKIYQTGWLTNNGALVQELEKRLCEYLGVEHLLLVANGTLALQVAYKVLNLRDEVITTPFSFVATTSSLVWEGLAPVFADIDPESLTIDPKEIERKITNKTSAIVPVHVYGNACEIERIQDIADKNNLKVIYDAAHCFGVKYKGESILKNGDISIISFHATKLFHTVEGGAMIFKDKKTYEKAKAKVTFGYVDGEIERLGINAKMSEFHAAMGLCVLDEVGTLLDRREHIYNYYKKLLSESKIILPKWNKNCSLNYSYFPVIFENERHLKHVVNALKKKYIFPRRYFHPSLNSISCLETNTSCKKSESISERILCIPLYDNLEEKRVLEIAKEIIKTTGPKQIV